jgi:hypothetical protein
MLLGLPLATFTAIHVAISLIGIVTGFIVLFGFLSGRLLKPWNGIFLVFTILTSLTGFLFPNSHITPGIILGILSMIVLILALIALYAGHLAGVWKPTYAITTMIAQFFNVFVLLVQSFEKVPALHALPASALKISQLALLVVFIALIALAARRFRSTPI